MNEHYSMLGLDPTANWEQVKAAHRRLIKMWHPDLYSKGHPLRDVAEARAREINHSVAQIQKKFKNDAAQVQRCRKEHEYTTVLRDAEVYRETNRRRVRKINPKRPQQQAKQHRKITHVPHRFNNPDKNPNARRQVVKYGVSAKVLRAYFNCSLGFSSSLKRLTQTSAIIIYKLVHSPK